MKNIYCVVTVQLTNYEEGKSAEYLAHLNTLLDSGFVAHDNQPKEFDNARWHGRSFNGGLLLNAFVKGEITPDEDTFLYGMLQALRSKV